MKDSTQSAELQQNIIALENKYWSAMCDNDIETAVSLTDFPCVLASKQGTHLYDESEYRKMFQQGAGVMKDYSIDSVEVRQVANDTAVIAYKVKCEVEQNGRRQTVRAVDSSTWIRRNGKWACAMHAETELPSEAKH